MILCCIFVSTTYAQNEILKSQLRVLIIGAHPDDAEKSGGTAAKYIELGHVVQLVSMTNGDAGHFEMGGGVLAKRRTEERRSMFRRAGIDEIALSSDEPALSAMLEFFRAREARK